MHLLLAARALDMTFERRPDPNRFHAAELDRLRTAQRVSVPVRVRVALLLTTLSLASAAAVRRLDDCVADDLSRRLATTDGR